MAWDVNRRTFVGGIGALAAAGLAMPTYAKNGKKLNVLMIVTDQEQSVASYPEGLLEKLPAHRELMERGMLVENYHVHTTPAPRRARRSFRRTIRSRPACSSTATTPPIRWRRKPCRRSAT